jgi:hypothetical protein
MKELAALLVDHEAASKADEALPSAFAICERLRPRLAPLMGSTGAGALVARAMALAGADVPWLRGVPLKADGSLAVKDIELPGDPAEIAEGGAILLAHLLGLLVTFIGQDLTLQLVRDVWPGLPADFALGKGNENEKP